MHKGYEFTMNIHLDKYENYICSVKGCRKRIEIGTNHAIFAQAIICKDCIKKIYESLFGKKEKEDVIKDIEEEFKKLK